MIGLAAPLLTSLDPAEINPAYRNKKPGTEATVRRDDGTKATVTHWMGTDSLGRDIYSRVVYGARASLLVGAAVAVISVAIGLVIGLVSGYFRWLDAIVMRIMDGLMAIPAILLAIALVSLSSAGLLAVIVAIVDSGNPARRAPGALGRAVDPRGALRRGGDRGRHAALRCCSCGTCCPTRFRR